jgi:hypothetical protein
MDSMDSVERGPLSPPPAVGLSTREQDEAAGGRGRRIVRLPDGRTALASVRLRAFAGYQRIYAYVNWKVGGRTYSKYVGPAQGSSRQEMLRAAWGLVLARGLLNQSSPSASAAEVRKTKKGRSSRGRPSQVPAVEARRQPRPRKP